MAAGRTFKGPAFVAKPTSGVTFLDFDVGTEYRARFTLTNVSLTFNTFKLQRLSDAIVDFFEISHDRPGRMSAGMSCPIDVVFRPAVNEDIFAEIPVLSETGPVSIPLVCTTKKVVPSVDTEEMAFGEQLVIGEEKVLQLRIKNDGALPTEYELVDRQTGLLVGKEAPFQVTKSTNGEKKRVRHAADPDDPVSTAAQEARLFIQTDAEAGGTSASGVPGRAKQESNRATEARAAKEEAALRDKAAAVGEAYLQYEEGKGPLQFESRGKVAPFSETIHVFKCAPLQPGRLLEKILLKFTGTDKTLQISLTAVAIKLPVFVSEPVMNLGTCVFGKLYRKKLVVCNRGKIAFKVHAKPPPELAGGAVDFNPDMGFVQPGATLEMGLKFRPTQETLVKAADHAILKSGIIAVPVRVFVPQQAIPVFFTLRAQLTSGNVFIDQADGLDFGEVYVGESHVRRLTLTNESVLPQKFGFVELPPELEVQPNDGFGVLLPFQKQVVDVSFKPQSSIAFNLTLVMRTTMCGEHRISVRGTGVEPPLALSHSLVLLNPASIGDRVVASLTVTNPSSTAARTFEWVVPNSEISMLTVAPAVDTLAPGESRRVEVAFAPRPDKDPDAPQPPNQHLLKVYLEDGVDGPEGSPDGPGSAPEEEKDDARPPSGKKTTGGKGKKGGKRGSTKKDDAAAEREAAAFAAAQAQAEAARVAKEQALARFKISNVPEAVGTVTFSVQPDQNPVNTGTGKDPPLAAGGVGGAGGGVDGAAGAGTDVDPAAAVVALVDDLSEIDKLARNEEEEGAPAGESAEPWSRHGRWRLPCFVRNEGTADGEAGPPMTPMFAEVRTVTVERVLEANLFVVDFGQIAVGEHGKRLLRVKNRHATATAHLAAEGLSALSAFSVVNALRPVPPEQLHRPILLQFAPTTQGMRQEVLRLVSPNLGREVRLILRGEGVSPVLTIDPPDGVVDLGHALAQDASTATVTFHNASVFPLRYTLEPLDEAAANFNNQAVFSCVPVEAEVQPGQDFPVQITFRPDHERTWSYHHKLRVQVPNQVKEHTLFLSGRCHARQLYCVGADGASDAAARQPERMEDPFLVPLPMQARTLGTQQALLGVPPAEIPQVKLTFPRHAPETPRAVVVGCVKVQGAEFKGGGGSFTMEFDDKARALGYFAASPASGNVSEGQQVEVSFTFKPPEVGETYGLDVGQWARTVVKCHLNGGFVHDHASTEPVLILLEGFIRI